MYQVKSCTYFYLIFHYTNYFSLCTEEEEILETTSNFLCFDYRFYTRSLMSCSRNEFPIACFTSPPGHPAGIPTQHVRNWLMAGSLGPSPPSEPLVSVTNIVDRQSPLFEISQWPLILPFLASLLIKHQFTKTLLSQYLPHPPLPSISIANILGSVFNSSLLILTLEVFPN